MCSRTKSGRSNRIHQPTITELPPGTQNITQAAAFGTSTKNNSELTNLCTTCAANAKQNKKLLQLRCCLVVVSSMLLRPHGERIRKKRQKPRDNRCSRSQNGNCTSFCQLLRPVDRFMDLEQQRQIPKIHMQEVQEQQDQKFDQKLLFMSTRCLDVS